MTLPEEVALMSVFAVVLLSMAAWAFNRQE
jgi:hypothetical protein